MGKFTNIKELVDNDLWDWYCPNHRSMQVNQSSVFKYECAIHRKSLDQNYDGTNRLKIDIRQFVEQNLNDTVIMDYLGLSYYYEPKNGDQPYNTYGYEVMHGYYRFFFESEASQVMFALQFSEHLVTKYQWKDDQIPHGKGPNNKVWDPNTHGHWR
jgi:hypothetical protein